MDLFSDEIHDEVSSNLIETFLTNYTRQDFLKRYVNVLLYQGDFGTISSDSNTTEIIEYFKEFVRDITSDIKNYNFKIVKKNVFDNYTFISNLLEIKEDSAISVGIGYDNVLVHYTGLKTETSILLNDVIENKIQNLTEFRKEFNFLYSEIQIFNQFKILRPSVTELDKFVSESNNYSGSIVNWLSAPSNSK